MVQKALYLAKGRDTAPGGGKAGPGDAEVTSAGRTCDVQTCGGFAGAVRS